MTIEHEGAQTRISSYMVKGERINPIECDVAIFPATRLAFLSPMPRWKFHAYPSEGENTR